MASNLSLTERYLMVQKALTLKKRFEDGVASPLDTITLASHYEGIACQNHWNPVAVLCRDLIDSASDRLFA